MTIQNRAPQLAILLILLTPLALPVVTPETASVQLVVQADEKLLSDHTPFTWHDSVTLSALPSEATALDLLHHVVQARGSTYGVIWFEGDAFVDEVNGVQTDFTLLLVGYYWAIYEDGAYSDVAINQIALSGGTVVELRYEGFPADV